MSLIKKITLPNHLYKKLEYIKFNGAEYLYLPFDITSQYAYYNLKVKVNSTGNIMGYAVTGNSTSPYNFSYLCTSSNSTTKSFNCKVFHREGSSYTYDSYTADVSSDIITNIEYAYDSNYKYAVKNNATEATINSLTSNTQHLYGKTTINSFGFYLGAINDGSNAFAYYCNMNVYNFYLNSSAENAQSAQWYAYKNTNFIPVQRISDNVCGLYDTKHKVFYAMSGTEITNNAAGPWLGSFVDDTENPLILDPEALNCYKDGDTYTNNDYQQLYGYITGGTKDIQITVVLPKSLKNITSVTVDSLAMVVRGVGGYVNGTSYIDYAAEGSGYTILTNISSENYITITVRAATAYTGATNNTPIVSVVRNVAGALTLTFNIE